MSIKNSKDTIRNRSRDLPVCTAVHQPLRHRVPQKPSVVSQKMHTNKIVYTFKFPFISTNRCSFLFNPLTPELKSLRETLPDEIFAGDFVY
jgi:hypothetical protein